MKKETKRRPDVGSQLAPDLAAKWVLNWRNAPDDIKIKATLNRQYEYSGCDCYGEMFAVEGCVGVVMYDALDEKNEHHFVRLPVDADGKVLNMNPGGKDNENPPGIQFTHECPPFCDPPIIDFP